MVVPRVPVDLLFKSAERTKGFNASTAQVELALGNVARVVGYRMRDIITRHGGRCQDRDRARGIEINGLLVA